MIPPDIAATMREALEWRKQWMKATGDQLTVNSIDEVDAALHYLDSLPAAPAPDWSKAPEWAMWWAVDANGGAYWHTDKPSATVDEHAWSANGRIEWDTTSLVCPSWRTTLQARPTEDK